ncbi:tyrosine-protein phosphatase [Mycolicibacterium sp.]|uniref:tyrosine-protein phosphatase n=1 Tax=Mycolicibacterium sp. TaxID=2320850 RepID=UPI0028B0A7BD|nr:tyrosine-protein phosphatase [Mycolicibacterium sp.]
MRPGRLFRSSELSSLDDAGRRTLTELGVTDVADLRSPGEVARRGGGAVPSGVAVHNLPFPEVTQTHGDAEPAEAPHESSFQKLMTQFSEEDPAVAARRWMTAEYERFPTLLGARTAVRRIITMLADGRPVLVHCFAGKDRTGFAVAVALEAAGVAPEAIMADYQRSNDAIGSLRDSILATMRTREGITDEVVSFAESRLTDEVLGVREEYLAAARRVVDDTHGGLPGFLAAAQVTGEHVARLRSQLLG